MKKIVSYVCISLVLFGCSNNVKQTEIVEESLPVINLSENVEEVQQLNLSDAAERVEIVKLETTDKALIGDIDYIKVTSNDIWVNHYRDQRVLRFSRDGRFLNMVGKIGQGPEEYVRISSFFVDDDAKEVYIISTLNGIKVYDYEGNFIRRATNILMDDLFPGYTDYDRIIKYNDDIILSQHMYFAKPLTADSLWSLAWVDEDFNITKIFINPAHVGREEEIIKNSPFSGTDYNTFMDYYIEDKTWHDSYNGELTFKFNDTDTIYIYDSPTRRLVPQYAIYTNEDKGDYALTHRVAKEAAAFNYFTITGYYPTKDYIYLKAYKGTQVLTFCYDKQDGSVKRVQRKVGIESQRFSSSRRHFLTDNRFLLNNDINGSDFYAHYFSEGKYWIQELQPGTEDYDKYVADLRKSPDAPKKQELLDVIENTDAEDNPVLLIAVLK